MSLSKPSRSFPNPFLDLESSSLLSPLSSIENELSCFEDRISTLIESMRDTLRSTLFRYLDELLEVGENSRDEEALSGEWVYVGSAGVTTALFESLFSIVRDPDLSSSLSNSNSNGKRYIERMTTLSYEFHSRLVESVEAIPKLSSRDLARRGLALLDGFSGLLPCYALASRRISSLSSFDVHPSGDRDWILCSNETLKQACEALARNALRDASTTNEVLYGRSGFLFGALMTNRILGEDMYSVETIQKIIDHLVEDGRLCADENHLKSGLLFAWHGSFYLGAAHGLMGIAYVLLHMYEHGYLDEQHLPTLFELVLLIASHEHENSGDYPAHCFSHELDFKVHWCHGATGATFLFSKAFVVFQEPAFAAAAIRAGCAVWERGLLRKGPGLCHGVSGNGYALLAISRMLSLEDFSRFKKDVVPMISNEWLTLPSLWRWRAHCFGEFLSHSVFLKEAVHRPDRPLSLFEGISGAITYLSHLLSSDGEFFFPFFELPSF